MRTLGEIITAVRDGERPDYEELRYAVCALDSLITFDRTALLNLATAEQEKKTPILVYSAQYQYEEHFNRQRRAYAKDPKSWVGWNNDPDNPEFLARRKQSMRIAEKILKTVEGEHPQ